MNINIAYEGSIDTLDIQQELNSTIEAAFSWLDQYIVFKGTQDVKIIIDATLNGLFAANGPIHDYLGKIGGYDTWEHASITESRTGIDVDPENSEFIIFIDPHSSYLQKLWWDPSPLSFSNREIPDDKTDGFSVVLHEILHAMGISDWLNTDTGNPHAKDQSIWDAYIAVIDDKAYFNGNNTIALLGEPLEVRLGGSQGSYHLGAEETQQPYLQSSIMNGYSFYDR